ncbi:MAG: hypothetical protein IJY09_10940 [Lachnospiraceae bacterium]|nr:hypothetical protein [Lachnospiraceae bacterium]
MIKKKLTYLLLAAALTFGVTGCGEAEAEEESVTIYGYVEDKKEYTLENEYLKLTLDPETTQFSLEEKETGKLWYSNPQDLSGETIANTAAKGGLQSTLMIQYSTSTGVTTTYNNFNYSIENGLYEIEELEDGLKVKYSIGNIERVYLMPTAVPESRMMEFYEKMEKKGKRQIDEYYRKYDINNLRSTDNKSELLEMYPDLETECVYVLRDGLQEYLKVKIEGYFAEVGYTQEDYELDAARYAITNTQDKPVFDVSIVYKLDGADFVVSVPLEEVQYKSDNPITMIKMLPYFGAGSATDEGYILVPDGNGGIINFNNGKASQNNYYSNMYGWDYGLTREAIINETKSAFPLFGICNNGSSFLCMLEEGSAYAAIEADVSGRYHTFNYANAGYTVIHGESMDVSAKSDKAVVVYEKQLPAETLSQRYRFINSDSYSDMAATYREYLMAKYPELDKNTDTQTPITVELVGAIETVENRLGFPVTVSRALTTYEEAAAMMKELVAAGLTTMNMTYVGWFNDGVHHAVATDVDLISELGGKKTFKKLVSAAKEAGVELYLEAFVEFVHENTLFDGFSANRDSAKYVTKELAEIYEYDHVWFGAHDEDETAKKNLVKASYTIKLIDSLLGAAKKYDLSNLSFADLGKQLGGDYNPKKVVTREKTMELQQAKLAEMKAAGNGVMIYEGNEYAVPYADMILEMELGGKSYGIVDQQIPFYSMVLHGLVNYTGDAYNLAENPEDNFLKSVETGAGLYFTFTKASTVELQETSYTYLYGTEYALWKDEAAALYQEYDEKLGHLFNQYITGHRVLADGVTETTYEDGTKVYVNYNYSAADAEGISLEARSYQVKKGGE